MNGSGSVDEFDKKYQRIKTDDTYCQTDEPCVNYMNCIETNYRIRHNYGIFYIIFA